MRKFLFLLIVIMAFVTASRAQIQIDKSQYKWKWAPLSDFVKYDDSKGYRLITYVNTSAMIKAIAFKKVEEGNNFLQHNIFFSEQPDGQEAGYFVANTLKLTMSIGNKKNKIQASDMQELYNGWNYYDFGENLVLYLRKVNDDVSLKNIQLLYGIPIKIITISPFSSWYNLRELNPPSNISVKEDSPYLVDYKDGEGRVWNWGKGQGGGKAWSVFYPDGSFCSFDGGVTVKWKVCFPDGKTIEYKETQEKGHNYPVLSIGNGFFLKNYYYDYNDAISYFVKQKISGKFIAKSNEYYDLITDNNGFKNHLSQECEKIIKEQVFSYLVVNEKTKIRVYELSDENGEQEFKDVGVYEGGTYLSESERLAESKKRVQKARDELQKGYYAYVNILKKKYGAKYVDAAMKGQLLVDMPFDLLLEKDFWLYWDGYTIDVKDLDMAEYSWQVYNYNKALGIYKAEQLRKSSNIYVQGHTYLIWVRNGKITQINK